MSDAAGTNRARLDPGLAGLIAAETVLSHSDGARGILWVRGYTLPDLVARFGYDGAVGVLWEGFAGEGLTPAEMRRRLGAARVGAFARLGDWLGPAEKRPMIEAMRLALAALPDDSTAADILATLPVAIGALLRRQAGAAPLMPDPARGTADDLLRMAHGKPMPPVMAEGLDTYWASVIDNGLNTSAFTARVVASSRASLVSAALGAYCAFTGELHGGAPGPTLDMLDEAEASGDVTVWAEQKLAGGGRLMGFGHRVFRLGDPRAALLYEALQRMREVLGPSIGRLAFAAEVEHAVEAAFARLKPDRPPLRPNIEINAALLLDAVGFPRDAFTPVFAVGRGAGWLAHAMEQRPIDRLIRPASAYIGPLPEGVTAA